MRGQGLTQLGDLAGALSEFNKALEVNKNRSLAHYRIAEVFFLQRNYQASANAYRESLNGDGEPRWTEVWSHLQLGKIFDVTGQRERAVNEYRQAIQTNDNTQSRSTNAAATCRNLTNGKKRRKETRAGFVNTLRPERHLPQGLKPAFLHGLNGTTEVVPFPKPSGKKMARTTRRIAAQAGKERYKYRAFGEQCQVRL